MPGTRSARRALPRRSIVLRSPRPARRRRGPRSASAKVRPFGCGCERGRPDRGSSAPRRSPIGRCCVDPVLDVDEADRAEREAAVGHHRHVQREGEHVRVGRRAGGRAGRSRRPWRRRRRSAGSARTPSSSSVERRGSRRRRRGRTAAARRRGPSAPPRARRAAGCWGRCRGCGSPSQAPSRLWPQTRTTLPLTPVEAGAGEPGDRLGDVDRQPALGEAAEPPAGFARADRHRRGHLRLDEAGGDGVDRRSALGQLRRQRFDHPDHAGLRGGVVGLAGVAGDAPTSRRRRRCARWRRSSFCRRAGRR